jgi:hypothetical protein
MINNWFPPDDDEPPFLMPGELDRMKQEARAKMRGRGGQSLEDAIKAAMEQPPVPIILKDPTKD